MKYIDGIKVTDQEVTKLRQSELVEIKDGNPVPAHGVANVFRFLLHERDALIK